MAGTNGSGSERWQGIERPYGPEEVVRLRGTVQVEHTVARLGAEKLWRLLQEEDYVAALGALTGGQAVQMVKAGLKAIYLSGWQVAADANLAGQTFPDQSLYPSNSAPALVRRLNAALLRADQIEHAEGNGGGRALRGPARLREEVRSSGRQGARAHETVRAHPLGRAPGGRRLRRSDAA